MRDEEAGLRSTLDDLVVLDTGQHRAEVGPDGHHHARNQRLIGLLPVFALIGAVNRYYDITLKETIGFALVAFVLLAGSVLTAESLASTFAGRL